MSPAHGLREPRELNKTLLRRVCGVLLAARQLAPIGMLGSAAMAAFSYVCGGRVDHSKTPYVSLLPDVFDAVSKIVAACTEVARVGSMTYDGWSARLGMPISGMTFNFIDKMWHLQVYPLTFFDTGDTGKSADEHEAILRAAVKDNNKIGDNVLIFAGTSDNEPAVALGVAQFLGFNSAIRCMCHTAALAVNDATQKNGIAVAVLERLNNIGTYLHEHKDKQRKLSAAQLKAGVSPDRVKRFHGPKGSRWHIKLQSLLDWVALKEHVTDLLPDEFIIDAEVERVIAEFIVVYTEVRRFARALEADRRVTGSRVARLTAELIDTLRLLAAKPLSPERTELLRIIREPRASSATYDLETRKARNAVLLTDDGRKLAKDIADCMLERCATLITPVPEDKALAKLEDIEDEEECKQLRRYKEALQLHIASLFDVNECGLDWLAPAERNDYEKVLIKALMLELPSILSPMNDAIKYDSAFKLVLNKMRADLDAHHRREPAEALAFWRWIDTASATDLNEAGQSTSVFLIDVARAYLSIQASSAPAERLFSDAGLQEGARRQHTDPSTSEMLLTIRHLVIMRTRPDLLANVAQRGPLSVEATAIYNLAVEIAEKIQFGQ